MTKTFEAGKTYSTRSVCDHNCIISVKVVGRTAKTIKTDKGKTLRVYVYEGVERSDDTDGNRILVLVEELVRMRTLEN